MTNLNLSIMLAALALVVFGVGYVCGMTRKDG